MYLLEGDFFSDDTEEEREQLNPTQIPAPVRSISPRKRRHLCADLAVVLSMLDLHRLDCLDMNLLNQGRSVFLDDLTTGLRVGKFHLNHIKSRAIGKYYWPTRYVDIEHYCRSCVPCQLVGPKLPKEPAHSIAVLDPMAMFGIDYIGPFNPPSSRGHRYILIGVDYMSRFAWGIPTTEAKATNGKSWSDHRCVSPWSARTKFVRKADKKRLRMVHQYMPIHHIFIFPSVQTRPRAYCPVSHLK
ncbi:uncharacterized protein N7503_004780 [Penicillium pulvis]|uniref:uncharacterized protein n=1 Tax=Penicillium pulvis TaxID=1562058 RepID=UPI00254669A6|nr:uncharacterized protein N7503_004780 [Penicillium pulvis]KAJ5802330.1 hypothetical protein N7503_004780 [Penicillium pulvis]